MRHQRVLPLDVVGVPGVGLSPEPCSDARLRLFTQAPKRVPIRRVRPLRNSSGPI